MPYSNEIANKSSHFDLIENPDVKGFLDECNYIKPPSDKETEMIAGEFSEPPTSNRNLPTKIISIDGSRYESSIDEKLPSTKVAFIKVSTLLINLSEFDDLRVNNDRFVDPFKIAKIKDNKSSLSFTLPSANIKWKDHDTVRDGIRAAIDKQLLDKKTRFNEEDYKTSLRTTLFNLATLRPNKMGTATPTKLKIHKCPTCGNGPLIVKDIQEQQYCKYCDNKIYPSDCLRLWEEVTESQSNMSVINRFMNLIEHILPIHYIRHLEGDFENLMSNLAFFMDGPLAIFGTSAWLHGSIMRYLYKTNAKLRTKGFSPIIVIGLQKSGQVVDYLKFISPFLNNNKIKAIDDDFRYEYIVSTRDPSDNGFGYETYYGQDFIYKTPSGKIFVFALPYHSKSKNDPNVKTFISQKTKFDNYHELGTAIDLINNFETDLYENALIPVALAHKYTAISLKPGGQVLDMLTEENLNSD